MGKVDPASLSALKPAASTPAASTATSTSQQPQAAQEDFSQGQGSREQAEDRSASLSPSKDDPAAKYLSGEFWSNLCGEVEGLKQALAQTSSDTDDEEDAGTESTPDSQGQSANSPGQATGAAVFGNANAFGSVSLTHPETEQILQLSAVYWYNVDPLFKILHRPTMESGLERFARSPDLFPVNRATEALYFSMYFAAVTSLSPASCKSKLGEERSTLVQRFRLAVEVALAKADYLNSTQLELFQALALYVCCLRNHRESRASWALLALVLRLAQAIGLHRDGAGLAFSPYEAELRRRLWWQIVVLDVRGVEDRGTEAMISIDSYNTRLPTNISDADFGPDSTAPLVDQEGPTDTTFSLCTSMCCDIFLFLHNPQARFQKPDMDGTMQVIQPSEDDMVRRVQALEERFVKNADPNFYPSALASHTVRLIILIFWLSLQYPFQVRQQHAPFGTGGPPGSSAAGGRPRGRVSREHVLQTAVAIMELQQRGKDGPFAERFGWWTENYPQWHPLAVALAELCSQTSGPLVDRAWAVIDSVVGQWSDQIADTKAGTLLRPIKKLLKKARAARAQAQLSQLDLNKEPTEAPAQQQTPAQTPAVVIDFPPADVGGPLPLMRPSPYEEDRNVSPNDIFRAPNGPFDFDFSLDIAATQDMELMDWTNWNEFVTDANDTSDTFVGFTL